MDKREAFHYESTYKARRTQIVAMNVHTSMYMFVRWVEYLRDWLLRPGFPQIPLSPPLPRINSALDSVPKYSLLGPF